MTAKHLSKTGRARIGGEVRRILPEIRSMIESARNQVAATANLAMVSLYWNIGRIITQDIQRNQKRAAYGKNLIEGLAESLCAIYGQGYSAKNLWDMKRFFGAFQTLQTPSGESSRLSLKRETVQTLSGESEHRLTIDFRKHYRLGWSHYRLLLGQSDSLKRKFYFEQAASEGWSVRALRQKIEGALFERVGLSRDTRKLAALEKKKGTDEIVRYEDVFKDPYVLDFLGLKGAYSEKDFEVAIIRNLEQFLSELGTDFCFIGRQYPMRIDDTDYFLDLLFYHRALRCLVAIDLKIGAFTAADKGQMDLYLSWLKEHEWRGHENEPVGLILCASKRRQHVELLLRHGPHRMQVSEYRTKMPSRKILEERLRLYSGLLEGKV